jgi:glycerophosphoryl diester phosphodiesterase
MCLCLYRQVFKGGFVSPISANVFSKPLVIGHRGFRAKYPENTLAGFQAAIDAKADMVELDVQLSRDGHLVVIHDDQLNRTSNGQGTVASHSLADLKKLDAGSWFHPRFRNERIPTLEEVLDLAANKIRINIEIKVDPHMRTKEAGGIERKTIDLVLLKKAGDVVLVSSFNKNILESLSQMDRRPALGVLTEFGENIDVLEISKKIRAFSWNPHFLGLNKEKLLQMQENGIKVMPYTVNSPEDISSLLILGVDGIFTDDPVFARNIIGL